MSALHKYFVLLVMFAGSAVAVASINEYENQRCALGKGGGCTCNGNVCLNSAGNLANGNGYTVIVCNEEDYMRCIESSGNVCVHSEDQTEVLCMRTSYWTGTCEELGNGLDVLEHKIDACDGGYIMGG